MKRFYYIVFLFCCQLSVFPQTQVGALNLLPKPQKLTLHNGKHYLSHPSIADSILSIQYTDNISEAKINPHEAYRLSITPKNINIEAITPTGVYRAKQTLNQLIKQDEEGNYFLPCCSISDYPAFRVRGFMHDVGRSFISIDKLKQQIALLSQFKINVFHWHLTEDLAWRLQSRVVPQLTDSANFERLPGKYYTIEEARELSRFCRAHHVLLIPEIDMPGHSAAFRRAAGHDMQSEKGMQILKRIMHEICNDVFPDLPYIHIGTDEVAFTNSTFVPEMIAFIRAQGKKVISWNPGWQYKVGEIDATQLWSYRGKAQPGIPAIDSRFHYLNHFDMFGDIVALYNSRVCNAEIGNEDLAGAIVAVWNDRRLLDEDEIITQNYLYPNALALAERAWLGGGSEYFNKNGVILPTDESDNVFQSFVDFERRMLWHKQYTFHGQSFPYVKQTNVKWYITDTFPNNGDITSIFPPEKSLAKSYQYNGKKYGVRSAIGGAVHLRHVWGDLVPAFYKKPKENHTAYAYTWVYSLETQKVGLWLEFQNYSRSEADLPPPEGKWDYRGSRIWLNRQEILPPIWHNTHQERNNEIPLRDENCVARSPIPVELKKGWNSVLIKLPVTQFTTPEIRLVKWGFTAIFVTPDGSSAVDNLVYSPERKISEIHMKKKSIISNHKK